MNAQVYEFFCHNTNYMWYCDVCISAGEYDIDVVKRIKKLESIVVQNSIAISEQSKLINELKSVPKGVNNPFLTPRFVNSPRNKSLFASVVKDWAVETQTPVSHGSVSRKRPRRQVEERVYNSNRKGDPILIVKPNNVDDTANIRDEIKKVINPMKDPVKSMSESKKGSIIIKCNDHESVEVMKSKLNDVISEKYECDIEKPKEFKPVIKVVGISEYDDDEEKLLSVIRTQNELESADLEIMFVREIKKSQSKYYTAYVRTDKSTFNKIMRKGRLNILWDRVKCYEHVNLLRCYKCSRFGHIADKCTSEKEICGNCSGEHPTKSCVAEDSKCPNCVFKNSELRLNLPVDHAAWDIKCPTLNMQLNKVTKRLRYEQ